jgi:thiamine-phosphate diphosphorylase
VTLRRPCLCLITDRRRLAPDARTTAGELRALARWLEAATTCVDLIQVREPDLPAGALAELVSSIATGPRHGRAAVVVNDRADVALAAGADGVHVKSAGPETSRVQALHPSWLVGRSLHTLEEARRETTASYLIFGTVFATRSKPAEAPLAGIDGLAEAARATRVPVLAIGGVTPERTAMCLAAGAAGVAAIGPFLPPTAGGLGVEAAAAAFREAMIS